MGATTNISWSDATWNPTTGCSHVSPGCENCYAETLSLRHGWSKKPWTKPNAAENVILHPDRLSLPMTWKTPRRVFVDSMSDLFHENIPDEFIASVFDVMGWSATQHIYQVLTKRPERMAKLVPKILETKFGGKAPKNVWLGVSVEDQRRADERIPLLRQTPAAVRFLSVEPLLGPVDIDKWLFHCCEFCDGQGVYDLSAADSEAEPNIRPCDSCHGQYITNIDWVIVGGESGPGHRPMDLDWARSIRDQCQAAGVALWFKQESSLRPGANPLLDGKEWHQFPEVTRGA